MISVEVFHLKVVFPGAGIFIQTGTRKRHPLSTTEARANPVQEFVLMELLTFWYLNLDLCTQFLFPDEKSIKISRERLVSTMAFRDLRNSNTFYQPVGLKRAGALQDVEKPAWQRVDATSHSDKDKENAPPNLAATTTSISPWKQTKKEVDNNELQQQDVELTHAIQGQKYLCGDVSQDHHVKNIRETISLTSQPLNVVRLNNGAYTSPIHVQSFPLVDPFRGLSKAKDPVIAPPKSSNPPLTHGRSTKEDPDCLGWSFDESLLSLEFLNIHDFAEQSVQRPHTINTSPTTNTNNTSNIPKAWNTLLTRQGTGCPFAPLPCEKYEMTRLKDGFPTLRNNDTSNFKKLGNSHELGRQLRQLTNRKDINAAHDAEKLIRTAIQRYRRGESQLRPDGACFNYVIHAYAELGDAEAAESLLVVMFEEFGSGNLDAEPNVRVFTNVLHAWRKTKSKEAPERCERILEHMHRLHESAELPDCKPDTFSYTVLFHCWAESGRSDAAERADRLFRNMKDKVSKGQHQLRPDAIAYSNMVNIFVQHPSTHFRAEDVLWEMVEDYLGGNDTAKPRIRNFNTILAMWSKSVADEAPDRAQSIVSKLMRLNSNHKLDCTPDAYTYSLLLKTW